jgi:hypothetical protein
MIEFIIVAEQNVDGAEASGWDLKRPVGLTREKINEAHEAYGELVAEFGYSDWNIMWRVGGETPLPEGELPF